MKAEAEYSRKKNSAKNIWTTIIGKRKRRKSRKRWYEEVQLLESRDLKWYKMTKTQGKEDMVRNLEKGINRDVSAVVSQSNLIPQGG